MTEDELKKADELHMEGKAMFGVICFVLVMIGIAIMSSMVEPELIEQDYRHMWLDGIIDEEIKNTA